MKISIHELAHSKGVPAAVTLAMLAMQERIGELEAAIATPATRLELQEAFAAGMSCRPGSVLHPPNLIEAAQAVLDRWNSPHWEWAEQGHTADLMHALRRALNAHPAPPAEIHPVAWRINYTINGASRSVLCGHNSVGDYRDADPKATSTPLYTK